MAIKYKYIKVRYTNTLIGKMAATGGGCHPLQSYVNKKYPNLRKAFDDVCGFLYLGSYDNKFPRGVIVPSDAKLKEIMKLSEEKASNALQSHCLLTIWQPKDCRTPGNYLVTKNRKRLPIKEIKGDKTIILDNGAELELKAHKANSYVVYEVKKGAVVEGEPSKKEDLGIGKKKKGGGISKGGMEARNIIAHALHSDIIKRLDGKSDSGANRTGVEYILAILAYLNTKGYKTECAVLKSTLSWCPIIETFIALNSRSLFDDKCVAEFVNEFIKGNGLNRFVGSCDVMQKYRDCVNENSKSEAVTARRDKVIDMYQEMQGFDAGYCTRLVKNAYSELSSNGTIKGTKVFNDTVISWTKSNPKWRLVVDDFRFRWATVLLDATADERAKYDEALACMIVELNANIKTPKLLTLDSARLAAGLDLFARSDTFLFAPMSADLISQFERGGRTLGKSDQSVHYVSVLLTAHNKFSSGAVGGGSDTVYSL